MKQITQNYRTGELLIEEVPLPLLREGGVLVRNHFSVISPGTERATLEVSRKGYIGKAKEKPELAKQVIEIAKKQGLKKTYELVMNRLNTPVPLGYSSSGVVIDVGRGAPEFRAGDRVACAGVGYANHAEIISVPKNLCVALPPGVGLDEAAFATVGAIALNGVRLSQAALGETVIVLGLGLIGLLTVQILKAAGCRVLGADIDPSAVENGRNSGADLAVVIDESDLPSLVQSFSCGQGADAVVITASTSSSQPVELAGLISRRKGRVVVVGDVGTNIPRSSYYQKELDFKIACSYGPGRYDPRYEEHGQDYPIGYVRWTERRNMAAVLDLIREKKIDVRKLSTHRFPIENASAAYRLISSKPAERFIGVLLTYDPGKKLEPVVAVGGVRGTPQESVRIGLIGAGNFAQASILPVLKKLKDVSLEAVMAAEGYLARNVAGKFGIRACYSDPEKFFENPEVNSVIIATRHNLHAPYVLEALKHAKNIYVEKPLALTEEELAEIISRHRESRTDILVGFNRRFAPLIRACMDFLSGRNEPLFINYRINAGRVAQEHWTQSGEEGGGRILGELCHFIDLCAYLCGARPESLFAQEIGGGGLRDNISLLLRFADSSVASISYLSSGDKIYPKERIELFSRGSIAVIEDFRKLELVQGGRVKSRRATQDKGTGRQIEAWIRSLKEGLPIPIPFEESVAATIATFMVHESLNKGRTIAFDDYSQRFSG